MPKIKKTETQKPHTQKPYTRQASTEDTRAKRIANKAKWFSEKQRFTENYSGVGICPQLDEESCQILDEKSAFGESQYSEPPTPYKKPRAFKLYSSSTTIQTSKKDNVSNQKTDENSENTNNDSPSEPRRLFA